LIQAIQIRAKTTANGQPADRDMLGQVVGRLADDGHVHQVIEQLQDADLPVGDDLPVGSWRPPEPPLEAAVGLARHGISRPPRLTEVSATFG
jgi:hypothetical protein